MNYNNNKFAYVVNWQDVNGKYYSDEIVRIGFYESMGERSWVHEWNNIENGLEYFLYHLPKINTIVYKLREYSLAVLRSDYIIIPDSKLIENAIEIKKIL